MKWLKSSTAKSWVINGKIVPSNHSTGYLVLEEEDYQTLKASFAVKSLLKTNAILVLKEEPGELKNTVPVLQESNRELEDKLAAKDGQLQQALKEKDELKEQAVKELQEKVAEIEKLKKQLAKAQKAAE